MNERDVLAQLAIEYWKLHRGFEKASRDLPAERLGKAVAQLRYSIGQLDKLLEQAGLRLATFDDEEFSAELPVSPINAEDLNGEEASFVDSTIEPAVIADGAVVRAGKVILRGA